MKKRKIIVGFHHGKLNPLPSNWNFPKRLTVIALINMWHRGSTRDNVPAFKYLSAYNVAHIKQGKHTSQLMPKLMGKLKVFAEEMDFWNPSHHWTGADVTTFWDKMWSKLDPYLRTETQAKNGISFHKSRQGQLSRRTCYNKMLKAGLFQRVYCPRVVQNTSSD